MSWMGHTTSYKYPFCRELFVSLLGSWWYGAVCWYYDPWGFPGGGMRFVLLLNGMRDWGFFVLQMGIKLCPEVIGNTTTKRLKSFGQDNYSWKCIILTWQWWFWRWTEWQQCAYGKKTPTTRSQYRANMNLHPWVHLLLFRDTFSTLDRDLGERRAFSREHGSVKARWETRSPRFTGDLHTTPYV